MTTTPSRTIPQMLLDRVAARPEGTAFLVPAGSGWREVSWKQVGDRVRDVACGLRELGLESEKRCAISSSTRFEWILADLGILCAGGATTTVYPSSTAEETAFILEDSGAVFAFAEDAEQVAKLVEHRAALPRLAKVVVFDGEGDGDWVITLAELEALGRQRHDREPDAFAQRAGSVAGDALATLIYTSGTSGRPKGVELTHDCWAYEGWAIDALDLLEEDDVQYLWLPLAHSFGKVLEAAQLRIGFPTAVDGRVDKIVDNLVAVKPTFVAAVPRIFEKVHAKVVAGAREGGAVKSAIFNWAVGVGSRVSRLTREGRPPGALLTFQHRIADRLVFSKLRARFGGRLRFFISGSAPLSRPLAEFFHACGVLILEGYGLTETSAASCVNLPDRFRFGTVGPPLPGTELKIAPADGEVLVRSRGVMRGYHGLPEESAEALDDDGWMHTGDIGEILEGGFLCITDRKKDLIKTSGGKYVAPQALEGKLKTICPYVSQVIVHGNNRNYCVALVALDEESIRKWAADHGLGELSYAELARHEEVKALIGSCVEKLNASLARYETLKKFALLPQDLSQEEGDLTPSLKLKRKAVEKKYADVLDGMYQEGRGDG
jgi:long-chain acyl-CoA synthetase